MAKAIVCLALVCLLAPNITLFWALDVDLLPPTEGILFLWDLFEVVVLAHPFLLIVVFQVCLIAAFPRYWLWFALNTPFLVIAPFELLYILVYRGVTSPHIISVLMETNYGEVVSFLSYKVVLLLILWLIMIAGAGVYLYRSRSGWFHRSRWWVLMTMGGGLLLNAYSHSDFDAAFEGFVQGQIDQPVRFKYGLEELVDTYPFGLPLRVLRYLHLRSAVDEAGERIAQYRSTYSRRDVEGREVHVVVLGESSRGDRWSLNGYQRDTSPLLEERVGIVSFSNAISVASATRLSVPVLLSRTTIEQLAVGNFQESWMQDMQAQGFKVYWLSTQLPVGDHDTSIGIYASLADETAYLNEGRYQIKGKYDQVLVDALKQVLRKREEKVLVVLHTLGSHFPYGYRYPSEFVAWTPILEHSVENITEFSQKEELNNSYDNSILYTDFILDEVIELLSEVQISTMWYISDHGQSLFDSECGSSVAGHGFFTRENFHVPAIFWGGEGYYKVRELLGRPSSFDPDQLVFSGDFYDTLMDTFLFSGEWNSFLSDVYEASSVSLTVGGSNILQLEALNRCETQ